MKAGELSERFSFEKRDTLASPGDEYGVSEGEWIEQFTCWTKRVPLRRGETVIASRLSGVQPYVLTIRASNQARLIKTDWRAKDARTGDYYNIRTVEQSPDRASIDLLIDGGPGVAVG